MSGWFDDNGMGTTEALDLYEDYTEKKVILGPWKHSGNADYDIHGFALAPNALRYDIDLVCFQWIEHYLKGVENGKRLPWWNTIPWEAASGRRLRTGLCPMERR